VNDKIVLGTAQFGFEYGINTDAGRVPERQVRDILDFAWESGIRFLETAFSYGESELILGNYSRDKQSRFQFISKPPASSEENIEGYLFEALSRLKVEHLYGYLIHDFDSYMASPGLWNELEDFKAKGMIEKIGFSFYQTVELDKILSRGLKMDMVQVPYNVFDRRFEKYFHILKNQGVQICVRSIFLKGLIFRDLGTVTNAFEPIKGKIRMLNVLSQETGIPVAALCLNFAMAHELIDKLIIGVDSVEHLKMNIENLKYMNRVKSLMRNFDALQDDRDDVVSTKTWARHLFVP